MSSAHRPWLFVSARTSNKNRVNVSLNGNRRTSKGFQLLAEIIKGSCSLKYLILRHGYSYNKHRTNTSSNSLAEAAPRIFSLEVEYSNIVEEQLQCLTDAIKISTSLEKFYTYFDNGACYDALKTHCSVQEISIYGYNDVESAKALSGAIQLNASIRKIEMEDTNMGTIAAVCSAISTKFSCGYPITLRIRYVVDLDETTATHLAAAMQVVRELSLESLTLFSQSAVEIANGFQNSMSLKCLSIYDVRMDSEGAQALASSLQVNGSLQELNLQDTAIGVQGMVAIAGTIKHKTTLSKLTLDNVKISGNGINVLAEALKVNSSLRDLKLLDNDMTDDDVKVLTNALEVNTGLQIFHIYQSKSPWSNRILQHNSNIGSEGAAAALAESLKVNTCLQELDLICGIGNEVAAFIANALKVNTGLQTLRVSSNHIGQEGARVLADALTVNHNLECLDLRYSNVGIGSEGAKHFATALKSNDVLQELNLSYNCIKGAPSLNSFLEALQSNSCIQRLDLHGNPCWNMKKIALKKTKLEGLLNRNQEMSKLKPKNLQLAKISDTSWRQKLLGFIMIQACQKGIAELPLMLLQKHLDIVAMVPVLPSGTENGNRNSNSTNHNPTRKRHRTNIVTAKSKHSRVEES